MFKNLPARRPVQDVEYLPTIEVEPSPIAEYRQCEATYQALRSRQVVLVDNRTVVVEKPQPGKLKWWETLLMIGVFISGLLGFFGWLNECARERANQPLNILAPSPRIGTWQP